MQSPPENIRIERLCGLAQAGDSSAEQELFSILTDSFRIFAKHRIRNQAEAEDVVQDALTVVIQKYKGTEFVSCFAGWAHNVLRNTLMNHIQTKATRTRLQPQVLAALASGECQGPDDELPRNVLRCLEQVAQSNRRFARALNLHYQGFTAPEIADRLAIKIEYLYVVLARARSMLVACLGLTKD